VEVMTVTQDQWDAQTAEIGRLMDLADNEDAAIQQLEAGVAELRQVHAAKTALRAFTPSELHEALNFRRKRAQESVS
jgi:ABC-type Fe3+-hydroxamate transport system substrate-binding protein